MKSVTYSEHKIESTKTHIVLSVWELMVNHPQEVCKRLMMVIRE